MQSIGTIPITAMAMRAVRAGTSDLLIASPILDTELMAMMLLLMAFSTFWMD